MCFEAQTEHHSLNTATHLIFKFYNLRENSNGYETGIKFLPADNSFGTSSVKSFLFAVKHHIRRTISQCVQNIKTISSQKKFSKLM